MFFSDPEQQEDGMGREGRDYWVEQLAEYWESGLTIQDYSELKKLPYERLYINIQHPACRRERLRYEQ